MSSVRSRYRLPATLLPDGEERQLWVDGDRITSSPLDGAEALPGRFVAPGLVDAHAHVTMGPAGPIDRVSAISALRALSGQGVLLVRDLGAPKSMTLEFERMADGPVFLPAGRWHAPPGRFYDGLYDPVEPTEVIDATRAEIARGARWIKLVADWRTPDLSYDAGLVNQVVEIAHAADVRVAAHTQWSGVRELVAAGVDSIEHGFGLDDETLSMMASRGNSWTPTLAAVNRPVPEGTPPERVEFIHAARERLRHLIPAAASRGVQILAGTDAAGSMLDEIRWLIAYGLSPRAALSAATTSARSFLGYPSIDVGAEADLVTFNDDPREDPEVLARPAAVLRAGQRVV